MRNRAEYENALRTLRMLDYLEPVQVARLIYAIARKIVMTSDCEAVWFYDLADHLKQYHAEKVATRKAAIDDIPF